jgi:hypothetical protein
MLCAFPVVLCVCTYPFWRSVVGSLMVLVSFQRSGVCLWRCFWFSEKSVSCDINVNVNWICEYLTWYIYIILFCEITCSVMT